MSELNWRSNNTINPGIITADKLNVKMYNGDKWAHNIVNTAAPLFKSTYNYNDFYCK